MANDPRTKAEEHTGAKQRSHSEEPLRVLIIDDEEAHAEAVAESLERQDYQCVIATIGSAGC